MESNSPLSPDFWSEDPPFFTLEGTPSPSSPSLSQLSNAQGRLFEERQEQQEGWGSSEVGLTRRVNNTIFKTGLSEYRKSIIDELKAQPYLWWLRPILQEACAAKNLSVFPKLAFMVRQLGISNQVRAFWAVRSRNLLIRKLEQVGKGKYLLQRYLQLQQIIGKMNISIAAPTFDEGFESYWGKYKQHSKHDDSKKQVTKFCKSFQLSMAQQGGELRRMREEGKRWRAKGKGRKELVKFGHLDRAEPQEKVGRCMS